MLSSSSHLLVMSNLNSHGINQVMTSTFLSIMPQLNSSNITQVMPITSLHAPQFNSVIIGPTMSQSSLQRGRVPYTPINPTTIMPQTYTRSVTVRYLLNLFATYLLLKNFKTTLYILIP